MTDPIKKTGPEPLKFKSESTPTKQFDATQQQINKCIFGKEVASESTSSNHKVPQEITTTKKFKDGSVFSETKTYNGNTPELTKMAYEDKDKSIIFVKEDKTNDEDTKRVIGLGFGIPEDASVKETFKYTNKKESREVEFCGVEDDKFTAKVETVFSDFKTKNPDQMIQKIQRDTDKDGKIDRVVDRHIYNDKAGHYVQKWETDENADGKYEQEYSRTNVQQEGGRIEIEKNLAGDYKHLTITDSSFGDAGIPPYQKVYDGEYSAEKETEYLSKKEHEEL